jgi:cobalt-zinc-cadmium resistance protein CzcA
MNQIVAFALKQRLLMALLLLFLFVAGLLAFEKLDIEAYPDPVPPLVEVTTQSNGQSAAEIERYITIPIEMQLSGMPHVTRIDSTSLFGLSDINVHFTYHYTYHEAEQRVIDRLSQLGSLSNGAVPQISPESAIGEIYRYRVVGPPGYSVTDLKTIQDWIVKRRLLAIPGIIGVGGWAGKTETYEVTVDENKLVDYGLTIPKILSALNNANLNVGGQTIDFGPQQAVVRGVGLIRSIADIADTMLSANNGSPIRIKDVATVTVGHEPRLGIVGYGNDNDIVQGIVLLRHGAKSLPAIRRVEAEVEKINTTGVLPPGVRLVPFYDRSQLIAVTTATVLHNMILGIVLIFFIQWIFLGDLKSAIVVGATVPFALFFAIILMTLRGESANLLSVGAIDFGLIVDATVIMVENICRHLRESAAERTFAVGVGEMGLRGKSRTILRAAAEVNRPIFFSAAIIIAGFVPLFTLSGVEGHIFGPMAQTYAYAIAGGLIAAFTVSPALAALLLPERVSEAETLVVRGLRRLYRPILEFALVNRVLTLGGALVVALLAIIAARSLGLEFLPTLDEGNLWIRASMPPTISLKEGERSVNRMRHLIGSFPEVGTILSQLGRPDDGTGTNPTSDAEFLVPFKPRAEWPKGIDRDRLIHDMDAALKARFPGVSFNFSQYIQDNIDQVYTGINGANAVKLFGHDLRTLQKTAHQIKAVLATVPGMTDLGVLNAWGQPTVNIDIDRRRAARYGLSPGDINATVQAAIGGQAAGNLYEHGSDRNFPIVVRLAERYRHSLAAIGRIPIGAHSPNGGGIVPIPLSAVAKVSLGPGYSFIYRENEERYIPIKFSVRGRPLGNAVLEAQRKVAREIQLPAGAHLVWVGEFSELQQAIQRLELIVPLSLALIGILLIVNFGSLVDTLVAASVMPMALVGGVFALAVTGTPFSVSAAIGFVALFGISVMEGIIILSYFNALIDAGRDRVEAIIGACQIRMRPVLMTSMAGFVGLLPAAVSTGIGSQVQKPLALVVVGGILLAPVLILIVLPVLIDLFSYHKQPMAAAQPQPVPGE